jgi:hypothetical protein
MEPRTKIVFVASALALIAACRAGAPAVDTPPDHAELAKLREEDQADRRPHEGVAVDGKAVVERDKAREARVKELYLGGELHTGRDYHSAALILQHAHEPEDYLLAHELCVVAIAKGDKEAIWLCAAAEDRFLMSIQRPQRFATQFTAKSGGPMRLYEVGDGVTDALRAEFRVPPLETARKQEAAFNARSESKP